MYILYINFMKIGREYFLVLFFEILILLFKCFIFIKMLVFYKICIEICFLNLLGRLLW